MSRPTPQEQAPVDCRKCVHCAEVMDGKWIRCSPVPWIHGRRPARYDWEQAISKPCRDFKPLSSIDSCPPGCLGIEIEPGVFSGCDCPNHPAPASPPVSADREGPDVLDAMRKAADALDAVQTCGLDCIEDGYDAPRKGCACNTCLSLIEVRDADAPLRRAIAQEEARRARPAVEDTGLDGTCSKCHGVVHHRPGRPGEYDHECGPAVEDPRDALLEKCMAALFDFVDAPGVHGSNCLCPRCRNGRGVLAALRAAGVEPAPAQSEQYDPAFAGTPCCICGEPLPHEKCGPTPGAAQEGKAPP